MIKPKKAKVIIKRSEKKKRNFTNAGIFTLSLFHIGNWFELEAFGGILHAAC